MQTSRKTLLSLGLTALMLAAACSPDDSEVIQRQTQAANDAFSTRVASVRENANATSSGQDLISALMELDPTATPLAAESTTLPATAGVEAAPTLPPSNEATVTPAAPNPTVTTPVLLATNTLAPSLIASETLQVQETAAPLAQATTVSVAVLPAIAENAVEPAQPNTEQLSSASSNPQINSAALTEGVTMFAAFDGGMIDRVSTDFASLGQVSTGSVGSMDIDGLGNLYVGDTTGVQVFNQVCSLNAPVSSDAFGMDAGIADLQGLKAISAPERLLVVDSSESAPALVGFARDDASAAAVLFRTTNLGGKRPWDLDYDPANDRLFVTTTDGNVLVFDNYFARGGAIPPSRMITPFDATGAQQVSVDLRGIVYVTAADALILSDVGGTVDPNDGQLLIIDGASTANGSVPVRAQIRGINTLLGDPSDIAFDGTNLYVAESFNGFLLRYDNVLSQSGVLDLEANAIVNAPSVRSITLARQNPNSNPVCSPAVVTVPTATPLQATAKTAISPPTQDAAAQGDNNAAPPTNAPPAATQIPPSPPPPTTIPASVTQQLPTSPPPTAAPPTQAPPTQLPPTQVPATNVPPTQAPPTPIPPTNIPPTPIPLTPIPPTNVPPTQNPSGPGGGGNGGPGGGDGGDRGPGGGGMGMGMGSG